MGNLFNGEGARIHKCPNDKIPGGELLEVRFCRMGYLNRSNAGIANKLDGDKSRTSFKRPAGYLRIQNRNGSSPVDSWRVFAPQIPPILAAFTEGWRSELLNCTSTVRPNGEVLRFVQSL